MKRQMASADDHDVCMISHLQPFSQAIGSFSEEEFLDSVYRERSKIVIDVRYIILFI